MDRHLYCESLIYDDPDVLVLPDAVLERIDTQHIMISQNNNEIHDIEKNLQDLNEVVKYLHYEVADSGAKIDNVEESVNTAKNDIDTGTKILEKTQETAIAARYKKITAQVAITAIGAGIGALIAGPVGFAFSLKAGAVATSIGTALGAGVGAII